MLTRQGRFDEAEKQLKQAVEVDPDNLQPHMALFSFYVARKDFKHAENEIKQTIAAKPGNVDLYFALGNFYFRLKNA